MPDTRDSRQANAREYLTLMLGRKPEHLHALIWTTPAKTSLWVAQINTFDALAEQVVALGTAGDTYLGMGWAVQDYGPKKRAKATEIAVWPASGATSTSPGRPTRKRVSHQPARRHSTSSTATLTSRK